MVIVNLQGGLGNQMFQYAAGKSLSRKLDVPLFLTSNAFEFSNNNSKAESFFPFAKYETSSPALINSFGKTNYKKNVAEFLGLSYRKIFQEQGFHFNCEFKRLKSPVFLTGFWQSEKYFLDNENQTRESFKFCTERGLINGELKDEITSNNSVAVHIRRGDYVKDIGNLKKHGVCPIEYYKQSFEILESKIRDPYYFVFTDDKQWAIENILPLRNNISIIKGNEGINSWKDMYLMTLCKHNIIANSTFSWWGAWLNANSNKMVIAPKKWFAAPILNQQTFDLIPSAWIRI